MVLLSADQSSEFVLPARNTTLLGFDDSLLAIKTLKTNKSHSPHILKMEDYFDLRF